ncbi:hypothetical protein HPB48_016456 [Haemaphysalis longicornis]|uniref:Uncharacterized protein n=1 Tax=Haemaphysalis longicornis TaxID=44386 RepID=A0A9J6FC11_HAELO|nr:hypothetical protein HPB48_016456 [Haemaphysalis longicornis]
MSAPKLPACRLPSYLPPCKLSPCPLQMGPLQANRSKSHSYFVGTALSFLNKAFAPGTDGISYADVCNLGNKPGTFFLDTYSHSKETGRLEPGCKCGHFVPPLKPVNILTKIEYYRLIALLSCLGKLMEKIFVRLAHRHVYATQMTGFRQPHSSIDDVLALVHHIKRAKAQHRITPAVFLTYEQPLTVWNTRR